MGIMHYSLWGVMAKPLIGVRMQFKCMQGCYICCHPYMISIEWMWALWSWSAGYKVIHQLGNLHISSLFQTFDFSLWLALMPFKLSGMTSSSRCLYSTSPTCHIWNTIHIGAQMKRLLAGKPCDAVWCLRIGGVTTSIVMNIFHASLRHNICTWHAVCVSITVFVTSL